MARCTFKLGSGALMLVLAVGLLAQAEDKPADRPQEWAQPIQLAGAPNLHKVSDQLYRGAQPTAEGFRGLEGLGIKTVISLRQLHSDRKLLEGTKLDYVHLPMAAWKVKEKHVLAFLRVATDPARQPVFVHCQHGADRTGTMAAFYRLVVQGWTKDEALREMQEGEFGYHEVWTNLIRFIREVDLEALKKKLEASRK